MRVLYQLDMGAENPSDIAHSAIEDMNLKGLQAEFALEASVEIANHIYEIDAALMPLITTFDYQRLAVVDRNILRLGAYELMFQPNIPPAVTLNEAIDIAKKYSGPDSGRFVNGVLAALLAIVPKSDWDPSQAHGEFEEPQPIEEDPSEGSDLEVVAEDSEEAAAAKRYGRWVLRSELVSEDPPTPTEPR